MLSIEGAGISTATKLMQSREGTNKLTKRDSITEQETQPSLTDCTSAAQVTEMTVKGHSTSSEVFNRARIVSFLLLFHSNCDHNLVSFAMYS